MLLSWVDPGVLRFEPLQIGVSDRGDHSRLLISGALLATAELAFQGEQRHLRVVGDDQLAIVRHRRFDPCVTELNKQPASHRSCPTKAAAAMDHDIVTPRQYGAYSQPGIRTASKITTHN
jgi:hypothetical protein